MNNKIHIYFKQKSKDKPYQYLCTYSNNKKLTLDGYMGKLIDDINKKRPNILETPRMLFCYGDVKKSKAYKSFENENYIFKLSYQ